MSVYSEIKKYLFYLVGFFCLALSAHIILLYLYSDAQTYAINGGTINIGIVGKKPAIDILSVDTKIDNNNNDTLVHFLYRGLLRYSNEEKKIVSDLTKCSIETFPTVRCTLEKDVSWSDGTNVTIDDIIATYEFFKENTKNENTKFRLEILEVQEDKGDAVFLFKSKDATTLDLLFLPILNKKDIIGFETHTDISKNLFSGPYMYDNEDVKKGVLLFKKNPYFKSVGTNQYFDQVRFGFGENQKELGKIIDADVVLSDNLANTPNTSPYTRPVLYGIFLNATQLPSTLRNAIFSDIFNQLDFSKIDTNKFQRQQNIFFGEIPTDIKKNLERLFPKASSALGYYFGGSKPIPATPPIVPTKPEKILSYFNRPGNVSPVFSSTELVEIGGTAPRGTTKVSINDYTLQNFIPSKRQFTYNARKEYKNLTDGINTYRAVFFAGKKVLGQESITLYYNPDTKILQKLKEEYQKGIQGDTKIPEPIPETINTAPLDPKKLYKDGKPFVMRILIQNEIDFFPEIAEQIKGKLSELGVTVEIISIPVGEVKKSIQDPNFSYDIVLTGINLGVFHYNILPFFHSGQVKEGYNVSKLRNSSLDSLMEKMTEQMFYDSPDKLRNLEINASRIINQESIFTPIASPFEYISLKNTVLGITLPEFLPGRESLLEVISKGYFKQGYKRSGGLKTFSGFFVWLKNELFSHI